MNVSIIEILGFIFGIAGVYLTLRQNIWCFPTGLVNVALSMILFFEQKLYADAFQQFVYIILLTYGWYRWLHGGIQSDLKISESSLNLLVKCLAIWLAGTLISGYLLSKYTDASTPWPDSAATVLSFIAQWMIARKKLENWILWIAVNITYIWIYSYKELYLYTILFSIYLLLAIAGYLSWNKEVKSFEDRSYRT
jgi:nicotinamide mononucleotide transporter